MIFFVSVFLIIGILLAVYSIDAPDEKVNKLLKKYPKYCPKCQNYIEGIFKECPDCRVLLITAEQGYKEQRLERTIKASLIIYFTPK
jgi:hypothetical protein